MEDRSERLLTHYVGGRWRAPLSTRMLALPDGLQIVCAEHEDAVRAIAIAPPEVIAVICAGPVPEATLHGLLTGTEPVVILPVPIQALYAVEILSALSPAPGSRISLLLGDEASARALAKACGQCKLQIIGEDPALADILFVARQEL